MKILITSICLVFCVGVFGQLPSLDWANALTDGYYGTSNCSDKDGNIYITGLALSGSNTFNLGLNSPNVPNNGALEVYIAKLDSNSKYLWVKGIGGPNVDQSYYIKVDKNKNVYVIGFNDINTDFDPGPNNFIVTNQSSFILKLDSLGNFKWVRNFPGSTDVLVKGMDLDSLGNIYVTGTFKNTIDFDLSTQVFNLSATTSNGDVFLNKLDSNGNFVWVKNIGGNFQVTSTGYDVKVKNNNIYVTVLSNYQNGNVFNVIVKCDNLGNEIWNKYALSSSANATAIDNAGFLYTSGEYRGTVDFDPNVGVFNLINPSSSYNTYLKKLDPNGNFIWAKDVTVENNGVFNASTIEFDEDENLIFSSGNSIHKYTKNGNPVWSKKIIRPLEQTAGGNITSLALYRKIIYSTGAISDSVDLDPDAGLLIYDGFINQAFSHKLNNIYTPQIQNVSNKCQNSPTAKGKLLNPLLGATKTITQDGMPLAFNQADSSFTYFTTGVTTAGNHNINVKYVNPGGIVQKDSSYIVLNNVLPSVTIVASLSTICSGANVIFNAPNLTNGGTSPSYQWLLNGVNIGTNSPTYSSATLTNNIPMRLVVTSNALCASPIVAASNILYTIVNPITTPTITITGSSNLTLGESTTLTATTTNQGAAPLYQWQDSTATHTWQNITNTNNNALLYAPLNNGDKVRCNMVSNANCITSANATSNTIKFFVRVFTEITTYPNPAKTSITIDNLNLAEKWQSCNIYASDGKLVSTTDKLINKTKLVLNITGLSAGNYLAVLVNSVGEIKTITFLKE